MHGIRRIFRAKLARAKLARKAFFVCVLSAYSYLLSSIFFLYVVRDDHSLVRHRPFVSKTAKEVGLENQRLNHLTQIPKELGRHEHPKSRFR
jgi:hypothetical protein